MYSEIQPTIHPVLLEEGATRNTVQRPVSSGAGGESGPRIEIHGRKSAEVLIGATNERSTRKARTILVSALVLALGISPVAWIQDQYKSYLTGGPIDFLAHRDSTGIPYIGTSLRSNHAASSLQRSPPFQSRWCQHGSSLSSTLAPSRSPRTFRDDNGPRSRHRTVGPAFFASLGFMPTAINTKKCSPPPAGPSGRAAWAQYANIGSTRDGAWGKAKCSANLKRLNTITEMDQSCLAMLDKPTLDTSMSTPATATSTARTAARISANATSSGSALEALDLRDDGLRAAKDVGSERGGQRLAGA
ncbi:hypothetical protein DFH07DRAFT_779532 [Mycena maculata]|uniref:Uncharacterized protein n=1 Tax=Mycena maculata TaxID=230809 RepID=A0AAD7I9P4_9AGAR|nr:hypothetical protein DFH07DRAFT_779532 [Mycena maculata]